MYKKKIVLAFMLAMLSSIAAKAEVLVILPETGVMASAAESIKRGFVAANQQMGNKYVIKFANVSNMPLAKILQTQVSKKTQIIVGPLDKKNVEELLELRPKVTTIALNQVDTRLKG